MRVLGRRAGSGRKGLALGLRCKFGQYMASILLG
jgi:hypothetical protein